MARTVKRRARSHYTAPVGHAFAQQKLAIATDHGRPVVLDPGQFAPKQQGGGWGSYAEQFLRMNELALRTLDIEPQIGAGSLGAIVRLQPGRRAGAIPLRSGQTGQVVGGIVVRPRFGWPGVGRVLAETGWHAAPQFLELPLVPGSGREVPPWVLAGPVLARLAELLHRLRKGYRDTSEVLRQPRGKILWTQYINTSLPKGRWHELPCRFPDLARDPVLRRHARWCLERLRHDLVAGGGTDPSSAALVLVADRLLELVADVAALMPRRDQLERRLGTTVLEEQAIRRGVEAMAWVVEERGLGGGRELDGLAWQLSLPQLWESYVEMVLRREAALVGAEVKVGRLGQTTFPVHWSDPSPARSLTSFPTSSSAGGGRSRS